MYSYEKLVLGHMKPVNQAETALRMAVVLKDMGDSRAVVEAAYAVLGIVKLAHDFIAVRYLRRREALNLATGVRGVDLSTNSSRIGLSLLSILDQAVELTVLELRGERARRIAVLIVEFLRLLLRLAEWRRSGYRPFVSDGIATRDEVIAEENKLLFTPEAVLQTELASVTASPMRSTLKNLRSPTGRVRASAHRAPRQGIPLELNVVGECLRLLRPTFYAAWVLRTGPTWRAWTVSLVLELISLLLTMEAARGSHVSDQNSRWMALWVYLARQPMLDRIAQHPAMQNLAAFCDRPVLRYVSDYVHGYYEYYRDVHFFSSNS